MEPRYNKVRTHDHQYQDCLIRLFREGRHTQHPKQPIGRKVVLDLAPMTFDFSNGFPVITERRMDFWKKPIAELLAFINGVRTFSGLREWGVTWWDQWLKNGKYFGLEPDDLGPGSYGAAFHDFPTPDGPFNQFENLIAEIKENPYLSTHKVTSWIPQLCLQHEGLVRKVIVAPCHGDIQVTILGDKLTLRMDQRSGDFPVGVPSNIIQYAALTIMLGHVTGFEPETYIHVVRDAHYYDNQLENVRELITRTPRPFPTLHLTEEGQQITNLFDFRPDHFELRDYDPHPPIKGIPVTT